MSVFEYKRNQYIDQRVDQKFSLSDDALDALRLYVYTFHYPYIINIYSTFANFLSMLRNYVWYMMWKKYGVSLITIGEAQYNGDNFSVCIEFYSGLNSENNINNIICNVCIDHRGNVSFMHGSIDRATIEDVVRKLGSMAYGVALALIETLSNDPRCIKGNCGECIKLLMNHLQRIVYFPVPDLEIYESVKRIIESNGIPFKSTIDIDEDIYRELIEKDDRLRKSTSYIDVYDILHKYEYVVDQNIVSWIEYNSITNGITIFFKLLPSISYIEIHLSVDRYEPILTMAINTSFTKDAEQIVNVISNWYTYVVKTLRMAIENDAFIKKGIKKEIVDAYRDYLETWLKVL
ncbi:MAG: hypothetical protein QW456_10830, partial [Ignisphaera sp.]